MIDRILVPLDGSAESARALHPAKVLGEAFGVAVDVQSFHDPDSDGIELQERLRAQVADVEGLTCEIEVGPLTAPVSELLAPRLSDPDTLVVMTTKGYGHAAALVGSVASEIVSISKHPVVLVGPACDVAGFTLDGPLIIAVRDDGTAAQHAAAAAIVEQFGLRPIVLNAMNRKTDSVLARVRSQSAGSDIPPDTAMVHRFANGMHASGGPVADFDVVHGDHAGAAIAAYADQVGASAIKVTTHERSGLRRLLIGSVTADVLTHAGCPVIAVAAAEAATAER